MLDAIDTWPEEASEKRKRGDEAEMRRGGAGMGLLKEGIGIA